MPLDGTSSHSESWAQLAFLQNSSWPITISYRMSQCENSLPATAVYCSSWICSTAVLVCGGSWGCLESLCTCRFEQPLLWGKSEFREKAPLASSFSFAGFSLYSPLGLQSLLRSFLGSGNYYLLSSLLHVAIFQGPDMKFQSLLLSCSLLCHLTGSLWALYFSTISPAFVAFETLVTISIAPE